MVCLACIWPSLVSTIFDTAVTTPLYILETDFYACITCMGSRRPTFVCFVYSYLEGLLTSYTGECGLVYKAYLDTALGTEIVAVKTVKGVGDISESYLYMIITHAVHVHYIYVPMQIHFCFTIFFGYATFLAIFVSQMYMTIYLWY